ncbi:MAG: DUF6468 domain-containing protein [Pseudomonadota bacterium]
MSVNLIIELLVAVLLVATCAYCIILSTRLRKLRAGQEQLLSVISKFDEASRRAEKNLALMQESGITIGRDLDDITAKAHVLADELSVMVRAGDHIAGRIEDAMNDVRRVGSKRADALKAHQ